MEIEGRGMSLFPLTALDGGWLASGTSTGRRRTEMKTPDELSARLRD